MIRGVAATRRETGGSMKSKVRRRRSAYVGFSVATLSAALAGCEQTVRAPDAKDAPIYASVADCAREHPAKACQDGWDDAETERRATAPLYTDRPQCEAQWGAGHCSEATGPYSAGRFAPALVGFMLMSSLHGPQRPNCGPGAAQPCDTGGASGGWGGSGGGGGGHGVYVGSNGKVFAGWEPVGEMQRTQAGGLSVPRTVPVVEGPGGRVSPGVTTRGGFGRAFGGFGGGRGG